jgi:hypothetical protein
MKCSKCGRDVSKEDVFLYEGQVFCGECIHEQEDIATIGKEAQEQCLRALEPLEDTISLVVTGHLIVEYWLDWLIRHNIPQPRKLFDSGRLTFAQKLCLAESLGLVTGKLSEAIYRLNTIRNRISHNLEYKISSKDLEIFKPYLPDLSNEPELAIDGSSSPKEDLIFIGSPKLELMFFCVQFAGYAAGFVTGRKGSLK